MTLQATVKAADGSTMSVLVNWTSNSTAVATVGVGGMVQAVTPGPFTITATAAPAPRRASDP